MWAHPAACKLREVQPAGRAFCCNATQKNSFNHGFVRASFGRRTQPGFTLFFLRFISASIPCAENRFQKEKPRFNTALASVECN